MEKAICKKWSGTNPSSLSLDVRLWNQDSIFWQDFYFALLSGTIDDNGQIYVINVKENIIYVVDKTKDDDANIVKKIELDDVIQDKSRSKCRFLHFGNNRLYIADLGLNTVYVNSSKYETEKMRFLPFSQDTHFFLSFLKLKCILY